jgi:hypothetical protein
MSVHCRRPARDNAGHQVAGSTSENQTVPAAGACTELVQNTPVHQLTQLPLEASPVRHNAVDKAALGVSASCLSADAQGGKKPQRWLVAGQRSKRHLRADPGGWLPKGVVIWPY